MWCAELREQAECNVWSGGLECISRWFRFREGVVMWLGEGGTAWGRGEDVKAGGRDR